MGDVRNYSVMLVINGRNVYVMKVINGRSGHIKISQNVLIRNGKIVIVKGNVKREKAKKKYKRNQNNKDDVICHFMSEKYAMNIIKTVLMFYCVIPTILHQRFNIFKILSNQFPVHCKK